jgi:Mlc titration factor MtfA (ptsG expression regulator)
LIYFLILVLAVATVTLLILLPERWRRFRRRKLFEMPIADSYRSILERNVPVYRRLPSQLREQLHGRVNVLLNEKRFAGCAGQQITDEVRVTIAGHACLLLLNREGDYFPDFTTILVYPDTYVADEVSYDGEIEIHERVARAGESWHRGPVILSWQDIVHGLSDEGDGMNVILHEFAHKLDEQNGDTEGLPSLGDEAHYKEWSRVLGREFASLEDSIESGAGSVLDEYALTSPAEFFAVATEAFFEKAAEMQETLPELYAQLRQYYRVDPASWQMSTDPGVPRRK